MTPERVKKLEEAFLMGCTDLEACLFADISKQTLYNYQDANPGYVDRKEALKTNPILKSKKVVIEVLEGTEKKATLTEKIAVANKTLDRKEGTKVAVSGANGGPLQVHTITSEMSPEEAGKVYADFFKQD